MGCGFLLGTSVLYVNEAEIESYIAKGGYNVEADPHLHKAQDMLRIGINSHKSKIHGLEKDLFED